MCKNSRENDHDSDYCEDCAYDAGYLDCYEGEPYNNSYKNWGPSNCYRDGWNHCCKEHNRLDKIQE